ncbi:GTP-binding protein [Candidatus Woesearchaeota archaeon]|nr:GTP-binding protein [Candidatus Woesearchaeota archaeon]
MVRNSKIEKAKSSIPDRIRELEKEIENTKYNKRTQSHIGLVKAKIAMLREKQVSRKKGSGKTYGYTTKRSGDASAIIVGFPSAGKSTLLNKLTNANSKTAAYEFTTLTCIPGMMDYNGARIQILDVPGIVEGAASGKGRGKEVLSVAINADLVLLLIDVFHTEHYPVLMKEVRDSYIRMNEERPDIRIKATIKGGISIGSTVRLTNIDEETIKAILHEFRITNADVLIRSDINADQLIDSIEGNRKYIPGIVAINKIDIADEGTLRKAKAIPHDILISCEKGTNMDGLKEIIYRKLRFMKVYCKQQSRKADMDTPLIMREGSTLQDMCDRLHRDFVKRFRFARVWGSSKFAGQVIRNLKHEIKDKDIVELVLD